MGRVRFFIDPDMTDQEILNRIEGIKNGAEVGTGSIARTEEKDDGSASYDSSLRRSTLHGMEATGGSAEEE